MKNFIVISVMPLSDEDKQFLVDEYGSEITILNEVIDLSNCEIIGSFNLPTCDSVVDVLRKSRIQNFDSESIIVVQAPPNINSALGSIITRAAEIILNQEVNYMSTWSYSSVTLDPQTDYFLNTPYDESYTF
jgi:hypothetical protein